MTARSKWIAIVCLLSLSFFAPACDDDDDEMTAQQVSETQAEAVLGVVIPDVVEFSLGVLALVQAATPAAPPVAASTQGSVCSPIPGIASDFFCVEPNDGVICPTGQTSSEWVFNGCMVQGDTEGTTIDGTVLFAGAGPYDLTFDLTVDGQDVSGDMTIAFGECNTVTYDNLVLSESGLSGTLVGTLDDCGDGNIDATIRASGFQTILAQIVLNDGFALITVVDAGSQEPLYTCAWSPVTPDTAECVPYTGGV